MKMKKTSVTNIFITIIMPYESIYHMFYYLARNIHGNY